MKFFIPSDQDPDKAEWLINRAAQIYRSKAPEERIFSITYVHDGREMTATVGQLPDPHYRKPHPVQCFLLKDGLIHVCTWGIGTVDQDAFLVSEASITSCETFE